MNSDEIFNACLVKFMQGAVTTLCERVEADVLEKGDLSVYIEGMREESKRGDISMVEETIALRKSMNPECPL